MCQTHLDILASVTAVIFPKIKADYSAFDALLHETVERWQEFYRKHQVYADRYPFPTAGAPRC
jgi:hypothetical protein